MMRRLRWAVVMGSLGLAGCVDYPAPPPGAAVAAPPEVAAAGATYYPAPAPVYAYPAPAVVYPAYPVYPAYGSVSLGFGFGGRHWR